MECIVTLHTEGVDRNDTVPSVSIRPHVTLHTEGVDRNIRRAVSSTQKKAVSPSTRRVWIEICWHPPTAALSEVTLHTEGVDRNEKRGSSDGPCYKSPSTRRVWIEISKEGFYGQLDYTSPSTRRVWIEMSMDSFVNDSIDCHPPHGGCG